MLLEGNSTGRDLRPRHYISTSRTSPMFLAAGTSSSFAYYEGTKNYGYWDHDLTSANAKKVLDDHISGKKKLSAIIEEWQSFVEKQKVIEREVKDLKQKKPADLALLLKKFLDVHKAMWKLAVHNRAF